MKASVSTIACTLLCMAPPTFAASFNFGDLANEVPATFLTCSTTDRCATTLGGALVYSDSGVTVSASGSYKGNAAVATAVQDAFSSGKPAGLGVYHQVTYNTVGNTTTISVQNTADDNVSFEEKLTLDFGNQLVKITQILFRNGDHNTNFTGKFGLSIDNVALADQTLINNYTTALTGKVFTFSGLKAGTTNLETEKFYINAMTVAVVPEPEAYGLAMAGMGVVAFAMRRRRHGA